MLPEVIEKTDVIVIGAGLSGLAAAAAAGRAGRGVLVLEKEPRVGGLCASIRRDGFVFDLGGHRFVPERRQTGDHVGAFFCESDLSVHARRSRIFLKGRSFFYPPRTLDLLRHLGVRTALSCAWQGLRACWDQRMTPQPEDSLLDWFVHRFGRRLTQDYFGPYVRKLWGAPLSQISEDGAPPHLRGTNMAVLLWDFLHLGVSRRKDSVPADQFMYPVGGIGRIAEEIAGEITQKGGKVFLGHAAERVLCQSDGGFYVECRGPEGARGVFGARKLVVTAPLPDLIHMLHPQPPHDVLAAAASLRFRSMRFFNVMMDGEAVLPVIGLTVPEERYVFFRVQEVSRWCPKNAPAGKTACVFEIPCQKDDALWTMPDGELLRRVVSDMKRMGLDIAGRVRADFSTFAEHSYPFYALGYRDPLAIVYEYLSQREDLILTGSPGLFRNLSMDRAIETGLEAAEALQYPAKKRALLRFD